MTAKEEHADREQFLDQISHLVQAACSVLSDVTHGETPRLDASAVLKNLRELSWALTVEQMNSDSSDRSDRSRARAIEISSAEAARALVDHVMPLWIRPRRKRKR